MHIKSRDLYKILTFYLVCVLGGRGGGVTSYFLQFFNNYTAGNDTFNSSEEDANFLKV